MSSCLDSLYKGRKGKRTKGRWAAGAPQSLALVFRSPIQGVGLRTKAASGSVAAGPCLRLGSGPETLAYRGLSLPSKRV